MIEHGKSEYKEAAEMLWTGCNPYFLLPLCNLCKIEESGEAEAVKVEGKIWFSWLVFAYDSDYTNLFDPVRPLIRSLFCLVGWFFLIILK